MNTMGLLGYCEILSTSLHPVNVKDQRHLKHHLGINLCANHDSLKFIRLRI